MCPGKKTKKPKTVYLAIKGKHIYTPADHGFWNLDDSGRGVQIPQETPEALARTTHSWLPVPFSENSHNWKWRQMDGNGGMRSSAES